MVGRREEQRLLRAAAQKEEAQFVVVYGRRRVGKTYLVRETFGGAFAFAYSGIANVSRKRQLAAFEGALRAYGYTPATPVRDWFDAFAGLRALIEGRAREGRSIVFIDEMPWMDTPKSGFLPALEHFWNGWAAAQKNIMLILCGSAASWITKKVFQNTGGLYNRTTRQIRLLPFTLAECHALAQSRGLLMNVHDLVESYMVFGGIPYYLDLIDPALSVAQNIDALWTSPTGPLHDEYEALYSSLFARPDHYLAVIEALATKLQGLTRDDICRLARVPNGGGLTKVLDELEQSGFIRAYHPIGRQVKGSVFQLVDLFTLQHLRFRRDARKDEAFWTHNLGRGALNAWRGYAFEIAALWHIPQIKRKLGIEGVAAEVGCWRSRATTPATQIDLVIARRDGITNLVEVKHTAKAFAVTQAFAARLESRRATFMDETGTSAAVHTTLVTTHGVTGHRAGIQSEVTLDDLFAPA